jgi:hypothetical protein
MQLVFERSFRGLFNTTNDSSRALGLHRWQL